MAELRRLIVKAPGGAVQRRDGCYTVMFSVGDGWWPCLVAKNCAHHDGYLRSLVSFMRHMLVTRHRYDG